MSLGATMAANKLFYSVMTCILSLSSAFRSPTRVFLRPTKNIQPRQARSWSSARRASLTVEDETFLQQAIDCARHGLGHTFPNPAVGCVLVGENGQVLGRGFHPRAGYPHAEIFALLEAAGHVNDGVAAAQSVVDRTFGVEIQALNAQYATKGGPAVLFADCLASQSVTAYVTLEPCCHYGKTPPCAASLVLAAADRVVVGFRDPNPRVDGGGVNVLQQAGVDVVMAEGELNHACRAIVENFVKRITPRPAITNYEYVTGSMRRALRALAARKKAERTMVEVNWGGASVEVDSDMETAIETLVLEPEWMEHVDAVLWREELLQLKLNQAVAKKKGAKLLGERIADQLSAHVAQTVGHSVLLYRPGLPPVLNLEQLVAESKGSDES